MGIQRDIHKFVEEKGPVTIKEIAKEINQDIKATAKDVAEMERACEVETMSDPDKDEAVIVVTLPLHD